MAEQGRDWGWGSGRSVAAYVVGGLGLVAFYLAERAMGDAALIPLRLFRIRAAAVTILASIAIGAAMFGGILILPLYMQIVHGASPTKAGLLMLPMVLGMMSGAMVSGQIISRTGRTRVFPGSGRRCWWSGCCCSRPRRPTPRCWSSTCSCSCSAWGSATACSRCC